MLMKMNAEKMLRNLNLLIDLYQEKQPERSREDIGNEILHSDNGLTFIMAPEEHLRDFIACLRRDKIKEVPNEDDPSNDPGKPG